MIRKKEFNKNRNRNSSKRALDLCCLYLSEEVLYPAQMAVIEDGVSCAEWSPDDGVCVVVTGAGKLILMSEEFDPIKDTDVRPQDFGSEHQTQV